eukprot:6907937-Prymnesium_polylepis.1
METADATRRMCVCHAPNVGAVPSQRASSHEHVSISHYPARKRPARWLCVHQRKGPRDQGRRSPA